MKIQQLYMHDLVSETIIKDISFSRLNVLVGLSGAGKTTIISSLKKLVDIAEGSPSRGLTWCLTFTDDDERLVQWSGKISTDWELTSEGTIQGKFVREKLLINNEVIIDSTSEKTLFNNTNLPTLDVSRSLIFHLKNDNTIKNIYSSLISCVIIDVDSNDFSQSHHYTMVKSAIHKDVLEYKNRLDIKKLSCKYKDLSCREKIYYAYKYDKDSFDDFLFVYTSIFPEVKSIIPSLFRTGGDSSINEELRVLFINIQMRNGKQVNQKDISSGMFKTMMILSELYFGNNKSPIIIDEIENSLGINCLPDVLTELNMVSNQVIITSHHPRVINEIPREHWSIVSRDAKGSIITYPAKEVLSDTSRHEAFLQLINSPEYRGKR
ncbi:AAA family ATPase [Vibrio parahaemolyticus]|nr:AAA family ATPase [Vibrio parahaemolyticus]ELH3009432.1 AAA family ATPase [Vibrio parahaemolyticus]